MRIISYLADGVPSLGVVTGPDAFAPVHELAPGLPRTLDELLPLADGLDRLRAAATRASGTQQLSAVEYAPLIRHPHAFWALALNFQTHIDETGLTTHPDFPHLFLRIPASFTEAEKPLKAPPLDISRAFDYEGELGVVIGRGGRHIPVEHALEHVAGYTIVNEGSVREYQRHNRNFGVGKNFEESGSFGPWLVTADEFGDPSGHLLTTRLNGVIRQKAPLSEMIFSVQRVIQYISTGYTLRPGDVIAMGTCGAYPPEPDDQPGNDLASQVGNRKIPGKVHMKTGDVVEVEISELGVLRNPIAADPDGSGYRPVGAVSAAR